MSINQEEGRRDKTPAHTLLTFSHWWNQSVSNKWLTLYTSFTLVNHGVMVSEEH